MPVRYSSSRAIDFISKKIAPVKLCTVCGRCKPKEQFHFHPQTHDQLQSNCMDCTRMYSYYGAQINWPRGYIVRGKESLWSQRYLTGPSIFEVVNRMKITYTVLEGRKPTVLFFDEEKKDESPAEGKSLYNGYLGTLSKKQRRDPPEFDFWSAIGPIKDRCHTIRTDSLRTAIMESIRLIRKIYATN